MTAQVGKYWVGFEYPTDRLASKAWERCNEAAERVSAWRFKSPMEPPHKHFYVVAMGEEKERVEYAESLLLLGSMAPFEPEVALITALRTRRARQAIETLLGGGELRQVSRTPAGRVLKPDGTMQPYRKE